MQRSLTMLQWKFKHQIGLLSRSGERLVQVSRHMEKKELSKKDRHFLLNFLKREARLHLRLSISLLWQAYFSRNKIFRRHKKRPKTP